MRWLLVLSLALVVKVAQVNGRVYSILSPEDFHYCSFLEAMGYVRTIDDRSFTILDGKVSLTEEFLNTFQIAYEINELIRRRHRRSLSRKTRQSGNTTTTATTPEAYEATVEAIPTVACTLSDCPEPKIYDFMSYDEITAFVTTINSTHSQRVETQSMGLTEEGRHIWQVKISRGPCDADKNFYIVAAPQGKDWLAPTVACHFIWRLIYECDLAPGYSFYVMPLMNPDGYEYSMDNDPAWIKNRADTNSSCQGVNLESNFSYKFGTSGSSVNECSDIYNGKVPFSEPETSAVSSGCMQCLNLTMLMTLSSSNFPGGESISFPWSYTGDEEPDHIDRLKEYANAFSAAALPIHNVLYTVEQASSSYNPRSGTAIDWATGVASSWSAFKVRLRGDGSNNKTTDASQIKPAVEEAWVGFDALVRSVVDDLGKGSAYDNNNNSTGTSG